MRKDEISSKAAKDEDEEEGELTTTKKRIIIKEAACYDGSKEQQPGMIIEAIKPKRQRMEFLEFRENLEGVGRPRGDRGREMFSTKSNTNTLKRDEKKYSSEYYEAYGDARRTPLTTAEAAHASNLAVVKRLPESAKPKLLSVNEEEAISSMKRQQKKTVPTAVRYKCLYRLVAIRLARGGEDLNDDVVATKFFEEENEGKLKAMVEEAERVERECVEASNGNKSTYLSKVAQFTKSSEFERVTEAMFLPKGSMLQDQKSEFARTKIDLKFCEFVRGTENVAFFRRAAKRARGEVDEDSDDDSDDED